MVREMPARCSLSGDDIVVNEQQDGPSGRERARSASGGGALVMLKNEFNLGTLKH
jgi:hypothetical protein